MVKVDLFKGQKRIPFLIDDYYINIDGVMEDKDGKPTSINDLNAITGLSIDSISVLLAVTYQDFHWGPVYWKHLKALSVFDTPSVENIVLGIDNPVESLEYPGFYMIPYFSDYVINDIGVVLRKSTGATVTPSKGPLGYYTLRMRSDSGRTQNQLRHRIMCYAFKPYDHDVEDMDVNHKDGVPGKDSLDNLEWLTRSGNMFHAYEYGLRKDNKEVQVYDVNSQRVLIFGSCSSAGRFFGVTETTISNRAKTKGFKAYDGYQFRYHPNTEPWPEISESSDGAYLVEFPDKTVKRCGCKEAARLAGLTRTSLLRMIREGRCYGKTRNKVTRINT